jgi:nicotinamidase-related amidase
MKPALLVIDVQKEFFNYSETCSCSLKSAVSTINSAIVLFRKKNLPVIVIQHKDVEGGLIPGNPGFDVSDSVDVDPQDLRITKTYGNAFNRTGLAERLRESGVDTLIITGFCAGECVLSTYKGAEDYDFKPIILRQAIASYNPEHIKFVEEIADLVSLGALKALLE